MRSESFDISEAEWTLKMPHGSDGPLNEMSSRMRVKFPSPKTRPGVAADDEFVTVWLATAELELEMFEAFPTGFVAFSGGTG